MLNEKKTTMTSVISNDLRQNILLSQAKDRMRGMLTMRDHLDSESISIADQLACDEPRFASLEPQALTLSYYESLNGDRMILRHLRSPAEAALFATATHPYGVFIDGASMRVGIGFALGLITTGPEFFAADACFSGAPSVLYCRRVEDRDAVADLLQGWNATFTSFEAGHIG